jgi:hypothetical protein
MAFGQRETGEPAVRPCGGAFGELGNGGIAFARSRSCQRKKEAGFGIIRRARQLLARCGIVAVLERGDSLLNEAGLGAKGAGEQQ